ncbi:MAG: hypothetical protein R2744_07495 [Bacteroidales bacterium]
MLQPLSRALLKNSLDERLFECFAIAWSCYVQDGSTTRNIGSPSMYTGLNPSNDGKYILVDKMTKALLYIVPYSYFPLQLPRCGILKAIV